MTKNPITEFLYRIKIHPYYEVPPCPSCGSVRTGYFVKRAKKDIDNNWIIDNALKNGELISLVDSTQEDDFFCLNCDYTWPGVLGMQLKSREFIDQEATKRGTREILKEIQKDRGVNNGKPKQKKMGPIGAVLRNFKNF